MSENIFIDSHCHLFNIVDIPLYETIAGKVAMGTLGRLVAAFGAGGAIASGLVGRKFNEYEQVIRFFERDYANILGGGPKDNRLSDKLLWGSDVPMIIPGRCLPKREKRWR